MPRRSARETQAEDRALVRGLDRLCRLAGEIAALRGEEDTLRSVVETAADVIGVPAAHVAIVDQAQETLFGVVSSGRHPKEAPRARFNLHHSRAATTALRTRRPVVIRDAGRDPRVNPEARELLGIGSVLYAPLLGAGKSFGLLILTTPEPHEWSRTETRLAGYTANVAAVALQTSHLLQSLAQTDGRLRHLLEAVSAIVYTCEVDFPFRSYYVGPEAERILGYAAREWIEDPDLFAKLVHPDDVQAVIDAAEAAKTGRGFVRNEYRLLDREGNTHWFRDEAVLVRDPSGRPQAWHGVLVDVTATRDRNVAPPERPVIVRPATTSPPKSAD